MVESFRAMTLFDCNHVDELEAIHQFDPAWRQNALSCRVILILQQMYYLKYSRGMVTKFKRSAYGNQQ
ncbi:hypothetical protein RR48_14363 [Papilio machaon]|uniref:Uncharacterized protein n=1 Tax=Papilio machaon TaxID=76193 RepID=A0A194QMQ1_PAPMA|nr:hypothetical protein RR48_14363 [Papilio machaon]